jgi:hypothetical protein
MKLLTKELEQEFARVGSQESKPPEEVKVIAKFFTPWTQWTWFATEYFPEDRTFFGYVVGFEKELGYFSLDELESIKGPVGLKIERDLHFSGKTLADVMEKVNV